MIKAEIPIAEELRKEIDRLKLAHKSKVEAEIQVQIKEFRNLYYEGMEYALKFIEKKILDTLGTPDGKNMPKITQA